MCSDLYGYFRYCLGKKGYYPPGSEEVCRNGIFGMFHSSTSDANKQIILESLSKPDGTVRVVFAITALGMGVNFVGLRASIHYGAPRSLDDYFQESGRAWSCWTIKLILSPLDIPLSSVQLAFESGWSSPNSLHAATTTYPLKTAVRASTQALRSS